MGRSVSTPSNALHVIYAQVHNEFDEDGEFDADLTQMNFDDDMENLKYELLALFPTFYSVDGGRDGGGKFIGGGQSEDFAFLENDRYYIGRSEYCGCLVVWIVEKELNDDHEPDEISEADKLRITLEDADMGGRLRKAVSDALGDVYARGGTFSNGEPVYHKVAA